jgi:hypothetical protein
MAFLGIKLTISSNCFVKLFHLALKIGCFHLCFRVFDTFQICAILLIYKLAEELALHSGTLILYYIGSFRAMFVRFQLFSLKLLHYAISS